MTRGKLYSQTTFPGQSVSILGMIPHKGTGIERLKYRKRALTDIDAHGKLGH